MRYERISRQDAIFYIPKKNYFLLGSFFCLQKENKTKSQNPFQEVHQRLYEKINETKTQETICFIFRKSLRVNLEKERGSCCAKFDRTFLWQ